MGNQVIRPTTPAQTVIRAFKLDPVRWWTPPELRDAILALHREWTGRHVSWSNSRKIVQLGLKWLILNRYVRVGRPVGRNKVYHLVLDPELVGDLEFSLDEVLLREFDTSHQRGTMEVATLDGGSSVVTIFRIKTPLAGLSGQPQGSSRRVRLAIRNELLHGRLTIASLLRVVFQEIGKAEEGKLVRGVFTYQKIDLGTIRKYATIKGPKSPREPRLDPAYQ
jgi:hypothetical protein